MNRIAISLILIISLAGLAFGENTEEVKFIPLWQIEYPGGGEIRKPDNGLITSLDNIKLNSDNTSELQNEEMVCLNPNDPSNAVAVWRDFRLGYRRIGIGYTFDSGQTWTDDLMQPVAPYTRQSDPILWVNRDGIFYASGLDLLPGTGPSGISVYKSTDGGVTWSDPTYVVGGQEEYFEDKQWFAMDQTGDDGDGNIYCVWDRFSEDNSLTGIVCCSSYDDAETFSAPVAVSPYESYYVQWPTVTIGPGSVVYVAWYDHRQPRRISFSKSYDFGASFVTDYSVTELDSAYTHLHGDITCFPFPAMSCDINPESENYGRIYIVYSDGEADWDIWVINSDDEGATWSAKVRVNDDPMYSGADQFHPWLSVDDQGVIHVCFLDRRNDPTGNLLYDLYYTRSTDGGATWEENHRISTESSNPNYASLAGLLGEYIGISGWAGEVQMVWTDVRNYNQDVYGARVSADFVPGDANNDAHVSTSDITYLVGYFRGENPALDPPIWRGDANGDCEISQADVSYLVAYFKSQGPEPIDGDCR